MHSTLQMQSYVELTQSKQIDFNELCGSNCAQASFVKVELGRSQRTGIITRETFAPSYTTRGFFSQHQWLQLKSQAAFLTKKK